MKQILLLTSILFFSCALFSQQAKIDSLEKEFKNTTVDSLKAKYLSEIGVIAYSIDLKHAKTINDSLITFSKGRSKKYLSQGYRMQGTFSLLEGDYETSLKYYKKGLKLAKEINDHELQAAFCSNLGTYYGRKLETQKSIAYHLKAIDIIKSNKLKTKTLINPYINLGIASRQENNLEEAISYLLNALKYAEENNSPQIIYVYNQIAVNFLLLKQFDKAEYYLKLALPAAEKQHDSYGLATTNNALGYLYETRDNNFEKALTHYEKSNFYHLKMNNLREVATSYFNIGLQQQRLGKLNLAKKSYSKGIAISDSIDAKDIKTDGVYFLTEYYAKTGQLQAIENNFSLIDHLLKNQSRIPFKDHYYRISKGLEENRLYKTAFRNMEIFAELVDSLHQKNGVEKLAEIETKYQTEKKEKENLALKQQNAEKELVVQRTRNLNLTYGMAAGTAILGAIGIFYYSYTRRRKLRDEHIISLARAKQKEHEKIGADLHSTKAKELEKIAGVLEEKGEMELAHRTREIKENIRLLSHELFQIPFSQEEFDDQIINLLYDYNSGTLKITHDGINSIKWADVDDTIKRNLYLIISEAVSNIKNHSKATQASIKFQKRNKKIDIIITDNGIGFTDEDLKKGHGIGNMRMRANEIKGTIRFAAVKNHGSEIGIFITL